jgi:hypothetical protein
MARPKGPEKERITVTILKSTSEILKERAGSKPLPTYLAECLEKAALPSHVPAKANLAPPMEVEPRFKK